MPELADGLRVIDADAHLTERHDLFTERAPKGYEDKVPHVVEIDGMDMWVIEGKTFGKAGSGGAWTFSIMTYVPSDSQGRAFIILLNDYEDGQGAGNNWSLQVGLDNDAGQIQDDPINIVPPVDTLPLITDEWVEFRAEIDLENDTCDYYYNDELFVEGKSWVDGVSGGGVAIIDAIDLYGDEPGVGGTTGVYFDDVSIQPAGGDCFADCDNNGQLNILDFVCYQGLFQAGDMAADCDDNGQLNILDFVCFQGAFQAGCP